TIAAEGTRFGNEIFRGAPVHTDWMPLFMQLPMRVIEKMWLMGGWMDADQALQFQLVQRVLPEGEVVAEARKWAQQAALIPTLSFQHAKDQIRRAYEILGLAQLPSALAQYGPPHDESPGSYMALVREK